VQSSNDYRGDREQGRESRRSHKRPRPANWLSTVFGKSIRSIPASRFANGRETPDDKDDADQDQRCSSAHGEKLHHEPPFAGRFGRAAVVDDVVTVLAGGGVSTERPIRRGCLPGRGPRRMRIGARSVTQSRLASAERCGQDAGGPGNRIWSPKSRGTISSCASQFVCECTGTRIPLETVPVCVAPSVRLPIRPPGTACGWNDAVAGDGELHTNWHGGLRPND
jgi:hypothetical protein